MYILKVDSFNKIPVHETSTYKSSDPNTTYVFDPNLFKLYDFLLEFILNDMDVYTDSEYSALEKHGAKFSSRYAIWTCADLERMSLVECPDHELIGESIRIYVDQFLTSHITIHRAQSVEMFKTLHECDK